MRHLITIFALLFASSAFAAGQKAIPNEADFPWAIHIWTIPLTLLVGIAIGWAMRDRKAEMDAARAEMLAELESKEGA